MSERWLPRILVADDEEAQRSILREILVSAGHDVGTADGVEAALEQLRAACEENPFDLVLTDLKMPGGTEGIELLARVKELSPRSEVILMTAFSEVRSAVKAMKLGAFEYLPKPFDRERLLHVVGLASEKLQLVHENRRLRELVREVGPGKMIGHSPAMKQLFDLIARVAPTDTNCLIRGESGTGKELVARAIHHTGPREKKPFIAINCAAIPETLIESELFGHDKGAFTGATSSKSGRFEEVGEGTLFLDEIGSMKFDLQSKLLRVIQEREFSRVGSSSLLPFRGRIVAATAQDLESAIEHSTFREDLYFRLNVVSLEIPPLRERVEDIPLLVEHFITRYGERLGRPIHGVTPEVLEAFEGYFWPGNVRELENTIERMIVLSDGDLLGESLLPPGMRPADAVSVAAATGDSSDSRFGGNGTGLHDASVVGVGSLGRIDCEFELPREGVVMEDLEADLIRQALERSSGKIEPAAQLLGISYKTLQYRIKKYRLRAVQEAEKRREP